MERKEIIMYKPVPFALATNSFITVFLHFFLKSGDFK